MGNNEITSAMRDRLERDLDNMQAALKQTNEAHKPKEESKKDDDTKLFAWLDFASKVITTAINAYSKKDWGQMVAVIIDFI